MAHEKYSDLLAATELLAGKFDRIIELLASGKDIPIRVRCSLLLMFKSGTVKETGTDLQLFARRRDGKQGAPKKSIEELMDKVDLGRRVIELFDGRGTFDSAIIQAAKEFGVSERTAKAAYAFEKKFLENLTEKQKARLKELTEQAKPKPSGLLTEVQVNRIKLHR